MVFICATSRRPYHLRHLAQRLRTATAAGLVPLLLVTSVPACATRAMSSMPAEGWTPPAAQRQRPGGPGRRAVPADSQPTTRPLPDWSRVEAVPVGTQTEVYLYDDEAPPGDRRVTGRFHAATADTLTLTLEEGSTPARTLAKSAVHIVSIRRPIRERSAGWIILVGGTVALAATFAGGGDLVAWGPPVLGALHAAPASLLGFLFQRRRRIYEVPPEAARLVTQVDVPVTDGDVIPRSLEAR